jgi:hypothetical protein
MTAKRPLRAASDDPVVEIANQLRDELSAVLDEIRETPDKRGNGNGGIYVPKWLVWMLGFLVPLMTTTLIWVASNTVKIRSRLDVIESNRFTAVDGERLRRDIRDSSPTPETVRRLTDHERRLDRLERP